MCGVCATEHLRDDARGGAVEGVPAVSTEGSVEGVCVPRGMAQVAKLAFEKVWGDHKVNGDLKLKIYKVL